MIKGRDIICFSNYYWGPMKQRYEHIMLNFAKFNRVLFIEFDSDIVRQSMRGSFLDWLKGPRQVSENFYVLSTPPTLPLKYTIPFFNKISQKINAIFYRHMIRKLNFKDHILWLTRPAHFELAGKLGEKLAVYDCVDEHSGYHMIWQEDLVEWQEKVVLGMERKLFEKVDLAFVSSRELFNSKKKYNKNIHLIPNACDVKHFSRALLKETAIPGKIGKIKAPVIGFVGMLDKSRIDTQLIKKTAAAFPDYSIVLVGPNGLGQNDLKSCKNIYFLGEVKYEELPGYLKAIDVALIPFKCNNAVKNINPLKLYEYLAAGKPIVCTNFPETWMFPDFVKIARNEQEFIRYIEESLKENSEELMKKRASSVRDHTWENRVETVSEMIEKTIGAKQ